MAKKKKPPVINTPGDLFDACQRGEKEIRLPSIPGRGSLAAQIQSKANDQPVPPIDQPRLGEQNKVWRIVRQLHPDLDFNAGYLRAFVEVCERQNDDVQRVRRMPWVEFMATLESLPTPTKTGVAADHREAKTLTDVETEILDFIREVGHRMTKAAFFQEAARRGRIFAEGTVSPKLVELKKRGFLNNKQDTSPKGYGLSEWD